MRFQSLRAIRRNLTLNQSAINAKMDDFYSNLKMGLDPSIYLTPVVAEYMEVMLNVEDPVPSILLDYLIYHAFDANEINQIRTSFERFHGSIFGFKMRPWTKVMLIKKALEFDCVDELTEWIGETHKNGLFLDDVSLTYLLANLSSEQLKLQISINAGKSDFITNDQLSLHVLSHILDNIDMARDITDDRTILLSMMNLSSKNEQISNLILSGLASLGDEMNKSERSFISPHFGMSVEPAGSIDEIYGEIKSKLALDTLNLDYSDLVQSWESMANDLHSEWGSLVNQRNEFKVKFLFDEEKREAGIQYTLDNLGVYSIRDKLEGMRTAHVHRPKFIDNDYALLSISDFELEQSIYERDNGEEWNQIRDFVAARVNEIKEIASSRAIKAKNELTNSRWEHNRAVFDEYRRPNSQPKLPLE